MKPRTSHPGSRWRRHHAAAAVVALLIPLVGACGSTTSGTTTLTFYIANPAQQAVAERCAAESGGRYGMNIQLLPNAASGAREQLLRRLAAQDRTMDVLSVDPPFMAEFANAGFLRPFTATERQEFSTGVLRGPLKQGIFKDTMWSAPFHGNTQLLWYRKSVLARAGIDPGAGPVTWDQLISGASAAGVTIGAQGRRNESLMVWVNALIESAGGSIIDPATENLPADQVRASLDGPEGQTAVRIMRELANSRAAYPGFSTGSEEDSRAAFQAANGGFMVNWPYVWAAFDAAIKVGSLPANFKDDIGWTRYPRVSADQESAPPSGGLGLSISAFSRNQSLAVDAVRCLVSLQSQKAYMLKAGDPGALGVLYDDPEIRQLFPMADEIRDGINEAAPRPVSPYYGDITAAVQKSFHPPGSLTPTRTPRDADAFVEDVLSNKRLI